MITESNTDPKTTPHMVFFSENIYFYLTSFFDNKRKAFNVTNIAIPVSLNTVNQIGNTPPNTDILNNISPLTEHLYCNHQTYLWNGLR